MYSVFISLIVGFTSITWIEFFHECVIDSNHMEFKVTGNTPVKTDMCFLVTLQLVNHWNSKKFDLDKRHISVEGSSYSLNS